MLYLKKENRYRNSLRKTFKAITLPGLGGIPLYDVVKFFFEGVQKGAIATRASAIAFNFLLSLGPALIFILTLIPYIPFKESPDELLMVLHDIMPDNAFYYLEETFQELFVKRSGLQLFGFVTAFFFATKGIDAMIGAFHGTIHTVDSRPYIQQKFISIALVVIFSLLVVTSLLLIIFSRVIIDQLLEMNIIKMDMTLYLLQFGKWLIIISMIFLGISFLYFLAPQRKSKWRFVSPGSTLATFLTVVTAIAFSYFVNHFAPLNKVFGSIGTLIALMLWLNFIALTLLIGFELNASISSAKNENS